MGNIAKRGYCYFLSSRIHGGETAKSQAGVRQDARRAGSHYDPFRMGILMSAYVGETDAQAHDEAKEGVWYFLKNCLKGHLRREGRMLTAGPGIPDIPPSEYRHYLKTPSPGAPLLGDADDWDDLQQGPVDHRRRPGHGLSPHHRHRRAAEVRQPADPVPHGQHAGRAGAQEHEAVRAQVAPRLREHSAKLFGRHFPKWNAVRRWHSERYDGGGTRAQGRRSLKRARRAAGRPPRLCRRARPGR